MQLVAADPRRVHIPYAMVLMCMKGGWCLSPAYAAFSKANYAY